MRKSCVQHPRSARYLVIHDWQMALCGGSACAAALLSFFEWGHNSKLEQQRVNRQKNEVAEGHGDPATQDTTLFQFYTSDQLSAGILGIYGKMAIVAARKLLVANGVISEHKNPQPRYKFDRTVFFLFYPDVVNHWLELQTIPRRKPTQTLSSENGPTSAENGRSSTENGRISPHTSSDTQEKKPPIVPLTDESTQGAEEVLRYLNRIRGTRFRSARQIQVLLTKTDATVDDCKMVIDWLHGYRQLEEPDWCAKYFNNVTPFRFEREQHFDKFRGMAQLWFQQGKPGAEPAGHPSGVRL